MPIAARTVALSRTDPFGAPEYATGAAAAEESDAEETGAAAVREVESLHVRAIEAAERLVYIETQYLSSRAVGEALLRRMADVARPVEIVVITNPRGETPKETIAIGLAQAKVLRELRRAAEGTPHLLALFHALPFCDGAPPKKSVYIHAKLMIVDDGFVTIGSANLTNRSMGLDTELHASFEVGLRAGASGGAQGALATIAGPSAGGARAAGASEADDAALEASIRALRCSLVREHAGLELPDEACTARALLAMVERGEGRLRPHPQPTVDELEVLDVVDPMALPFDPDGIEDSAEDRSLFVGGVSRLWSRLTGATR